jgi:hypothetical protein
MTDENDNGSLQSEAPLLNVCPHCGTETEHGFGLAGGGYGVYVYCPKEGCDYFAKMQVRD